MYCVRNVVISVFITECDLVYKHLEKCLGARNLDDSRTDLFGTIVPNLDPKRCHLTLYNLRI